MLFDFIRGEFDFLELMIGLFSRLFVVFCTMPIHEYAHALIATKLGDKTPKLSGRLTINPLAHIDWLGALMIFLCGFGYAKPVSVNPRNFKNPKSGMALTAIAGPISNLLMGLLFVFLSVLVQNICHSTNEMIVYSICVFLYFAAAINVNLAVFNLLPIPPLDGSRILQLFIPKKYYFKFLQYERYITIAVLILIISGVLSKPLSIASSLILDLFTHIAEFPFTFI